jgi:probable HAF family extracellular repeat protein
MGKNPKRACITIACFVVAASFCGAQQYEIIDLGTLGGTISRAEEITEDGVISGYASIASGAVYPVLWIDGAIQDLGAPPFGGGKAVGVNNTGQVVVKAEGSPQSFRGFLWEGGTWTDLGLLPGRNECIPEAIDNDGRIVGTCLTLGGGNAAAFIWDAGEMTDLGTLSGTARAYGINQMGQVVGHCWANQPGGNGEQRAFLWQNDVMTGLTPLPDRGNSQAFDINDLGDVVGSSWYPTGPYSLSVDRATLWRDGGEEVVDLGYTPGPEVCTYGFPFYTDNIATSVNNHRQVVGHAQCISSGGALAAFLWQDGVMHNLNDLIPPGSGWDLVKALDINDAGQIVGFGLPPGGGSYDLRAFLLVPRNTLDAELTCTPPSGTLPFNVHFAVTLANTYIGMSRIVDARISVALAGGQFYPSWKSGQVVLGAGNSYTTTFNQRLPYAGALIGTNSFTLIAEDTTSSPYNQPPYPPAGDTGTSACELVGALSANGI